MKKRLTWVFGCYLFVSVMQAGAVTLSLEPTDMTAKTGDSIRLDLVIAGLGDHAGDSLGDFDLGLVYDRAALSFTGYSLANYLGDITLFEAIDYSLAEYAAGNIGLTEVSLLLPDELDALQADSFTLATLDFTVDLLARGKTTFVSIDTVWALGDAYGDWLALEGTSGAVITGVAEPTGLMLMGMGLVGLGIFRRRSKTLSSKGMSFEGNNTHGRWDPGADAESVKLGLS